MIQRNGGGQTADTIGQQRVENLLGRHLLAPAELGFTDKPPPGAVIAAPRSCQAHSLPVSNSAGVLPTKRIGVAGPPRVQIFVKGRSRVARKPVTHRRLNAVRDDGGAHDLRGARWKMAQSRKKLERQDAVAS